MLEKIETEAQLEELLSEPDEKVIKVISEISGDILLLGVSGKIGPSLAKLLVKSCQIAGCRKRIIGVARFSQPAIRDFLHQSGVEIITCDLLEEEQVKKLPRVENIIYLAGMKFGTTENQPLSWAMNVYLPALVASHFRNSRIVAFSTGNVYPLVPVSSGGCKETDPVGPVGEYAQSCLGRERIFQYFSCKYGLAGCLIRLNYAVELRYGVLVDIALKVKEGQAIPLTTGYFNVIWQGDANRATAQCLRLCQSPLKIINLTGPEIVSVRQAANRFGELLGKKPVFQGKEAETALLADASRAISLFGLPQVTVEKMIYWIAAWISSGGRVYNKPTHFEVRDGNF